MIEALQCVTWPCCLNGPSSVRPDSVCVSNASGCNRVGGPSELYACKYRKFARRPHFLQAIHCCRAATAVPDARRPQQRLPAGHDVRADGNEEMHAKLVIALRCRRKVP